MLKLNPDVFTISKFKRRKLGKKSPLRTHRVLTLRNEKLLIHTRRTRKHGHDLMQIILLDREC